MTLQELHELTGKVLKERPELAQHTIFIGSQDRFGKFDSCVALTEDDIQKITLQTNCCILEEEEILWQVN